MRLHDVLKHLTDSERFVRLARRLLAPSTRRRQWAIRLYLRLANSRSKVNLSVVPRRLLAKVDVVHFPIIPWDYRYQRPQQLCSMLGKNGHRVFYVNQFLLPSVEPVKLRPITQNVFEMSLSLSNQFDIQNDIWTHHQINSLVASLETAAKVLDIDAISMVAFPTWSEIALELRRRLGWKIIYDCMDEHSGFSAVNEARTAEEEQLLRESNLVVVTSSALERKAARFRNGNVPMIPNGCDFQHFSILPPNSLLSGLKKPIIGYYGAIADWFDCDLIQFVAKQKGDWTFILIGSTLYSEVHKLKNLANVHLLGEKPYSELPKYLYWFDVCMIPFKLNKLIEATNPVKFYEYLSSGKPVVSVKLPELLKHSDLCYIAEDKADFLGKIEAALAENDKQLVQRRIEFARDNTWEKRYEQLSREISRLND